MFKPGDKVVCNTNMYKRVKKGTILEVNKVVDYGKNMWVKGAIGLFKTKHFSLHNSEQAQNNNNSLKKYKVLVPFIDIDNECGDDIESRIEFVKDIINSTDPSISDLIHVIKDGENPLDYVYGDQESKSKQWFVFEFTGLLEFEAKFKRIE